MKWKKKEFTDGIHTFYEAIASFAHGGCNEINIQVEIKLEREIRL